jgi:hypothetical protein
MNKITSGYLQCNAIPYCHKFEGGNMATTVDKSYFNDDI